jgi:hypothetical protein
VELVELVELVQDQAAEGEAAVVAVVRAGDRPLLIDAEVGNASR